MCFQEADLWNKKKLLLSGTFLHMGHFMDNCQLIVSTIHSYTLLFSVISFLNYFCWKELMLIAFSLNLFSLRQNLSFHTQLINKCGITVDVDLSFLSSFRTSGPYQTGYVRNYTSHVSHSWVGQGCAWREMESISCIKYNKQNSVTTRQWNKEIDQNVPVVLNYKIHCTVYIVCYSTKSLYYM